MIKHHEPLETAGPTVGAGAPAAGTAEAAPQDESEHGTLQKLKVMQFNIWLGGSEVEGGRAGIADTVATVEPDVVMLSESSPERVTNLLADLAERGLTYFDNKNPDDRAVLSRYPIIEHTSFPSWSKAVFSFGGTEIAAYSGHLEYRYYVTYLPRGYGGGTPPPLETSEYGWKKIPTGPITDADLIMRLNEASGRTKVTQTVLADAAEERSAGRLTLLAGDFNEPSHQDWDHRTQDLFDHHGTNVTWSTTKAIEDAGFCDSYREINPDPVLTPGFTWPSDNPGADISKLTWAPDADERDRIDFVFYYPDERLRLHDSLLVGPSGSIVRSKRVQEPGKDRFWCPTWTWPTDHKVVLSTFHIATR
ncbi:endonuclease [Streptomyces sp. WAC 06783]|uniref:endonuclease/exonuclease/phosphatase family protein n=1 Tax=Streptomyces sp. WAC 06783 TaxID=2203211 RepID=UPI000F745060|nr:endonuclease/exonuclease/phosphatase family protein [Streptomyces sp. WAC 06783]RSO09266.1 endonuclease [Streptomyces sp. WAC 06783]